MEKVNPLRDRYHLMAYLVWTMEQTSFSWRSFDSHNAANEERSGPIAIITQIRYVWIYRHAD
jgi:hypothetical protein